MKKLITILLLTVCTTVTIAQNNNELTKVETVKFLQNKLDEAKQECVIESTGSRTFIKSVSIGYVDSTLNLKVVSRNASSESSDSSKVTWNDWEEVQYDDFSPSDIISITDVPQYYKQPVGYLLIKLADKRCRSSSERNKVAKTAVVDTLDLEYPKRRDDNSRYAQYVHIPYPKANPENFNKIKTAFEHLKKLSLKNGFGFLPNERF
jgi:hypothetical protein